MPYFDQTVRFGKIPVIGFVPESATSAPSSPVNGQLWWDTSIHKLKVWVTSTTTWYTLYDARDLTATFDPRYQPLDADLTSIAALATNTFGRSLLTLADTTALTGQIVAASETVQGKVELATAAETTTGTDNTRAVHPQGLKVELDKKAPTTHTHAGGDITGVIDLARLGTTPATGEYLKAGGATGSADWVPPSTIKTDLALVKSDVGLGNVDNTSDANKPVSTATQTALNGKENSITAGTASQYWTGLKTWATLDKTAVGLGNVDNTSDVNKPVSTATQTALNGKANTAHTHAAADVASGVLDVARLGTTPAATEYLKSGGATGSADWVAPSVLKTDLALVKGDVGLGNVDNTADTAKPVSTAQQTALNLKANDNAVVHLTGNESIAGVKTFTDPLAFEEEATSPAAPSSGARFFTRGGSMWVRTPTNEYPLDVAQAAVNLIINGNMETAKAGTPPVEPANWSGFWHNGDAYMAQSSAYAAGGLFSGRAHIGTTETDNVVCQSDVFPVVGGSTLLVEFDIKGEAGSQSIIELQSSVDATGGAPNFFVSGTWVYGAGTIVFTDSNWQHITRAIPVYAGHTLARLCIRYGHVTGNAAAHEAYIDNVTARIDPTAQIPNQWIKPEVRLVQIANMTLSGIGQNIDGQTVVANDRILCVAQTNPKDNGIYVATDPGAWIRAADADTATELAGSTVAVQYGNVYGGTRWGTSFKGGQVVGTDPMNWQQTGGPDTIEYITATTNTNLTTSGAFQTVPFNVKLAGSTTMVLQSGHVVIGKPGLYHVIGTITLNQGGNTGYIDCQMRHWRSGVQQIMKSGVESGTQYSNTVIQGIFDCQQGDTIDIAVATQSAGGTLEGAFNRQQITVFRMVGPGSNPGAAAVAAGFRATAAQTLTNGVVTAVNLPATDHNTGGNFTLSGNNLVTVGTEGIYEISAGLSMAATGAAGRKMISVEWFSGTDPGVGSATQVAREDMYATTGGQWVTYCVADQIYLPAGAKIRLTAYQNIGGNLDIVYVQPVARLNIKSVTAPAPTAPTDSYRKVDPSADLVVTGTTPTLVPNLATTITSPGPSATYVVRGTFSVETTSAVGGLSCYVDGSAQPGNIVSNINGRLSTSYSWVVTGLAAGTHTIDLRGNAGAAGQTLNVRTLGTCMEVWGLGGYVTVASNDTGWIPVPFNAGWAQYAGWDACQYRRKDGIVYLQGLAQGPNPAAGGTIFTLPVGFRPKGNQHVATAVQGLFGILNVFNDGRVVLNTGTTASPWVSLQIAPWPADA